MGDIRLFRFVGGIVYWAIAGFKGRFSDMKYKQNSVIVGFVAVTVLFIALIYINDYLGII